MALTPEDIGIIGVVSALVSSAIGGVFGYFQARRLSKFQADLDIRVQKAGHLHTRRAEVVETLYSHMWEFLCAANHYTVPIKWAGAATDEEKVENLSKQAGQFHDYFQKNRVYFDDELADKIKHLFDTVHGPCIYLATIKQTAGVDVKEIWEQERKTFSVINEKVPPILKIIRREIHVILGVAEPEKPMKK